MEQTINKKPVYCFDLDGTLSDTSKRIHLIENNKQKNWDAFFAGIKDDATIEPVCRLARHLETIVDIVAITARPEKCRDDTIEWCSNNGIYFKKIYMRPDNDSRPDNIVKPELIKQIESDGWLPIMFFDDRTRVVNSIRDAGYVCAQVAPGDFDQAPYYKMADSKANLTLMVGPVGAGKSTYVKENFSPDQVVCPDDIRKQWYGDHTMWYPDNSLPHDDPYNVKCRHEQGRVWSYVHELIRTRILHNLDTVVDATLLTKKDRDNIINILPEDVNITYVVINRPLEAKLASKGWRSDELVTHYDTRFNNVKKNVLKGDGRSNVTVINRT